MSDRAAVVAEDEVLRTLPGLAPQAEMLRALPSARPVTMGRELPAGRAEAPRACRAEGAAGESESLPCVDAAAPTSPAAAGETRMGSCRDTHAPTRLPGRALMPS